MISSKYSVIEFLEILKTKEAVQLNRINIKLDQCEPHLEFKVRDSICSLLISSASSPPPPPAALFPLKEFLRVESSDTRTCTVYSVRCGVKCSCVVFSDEYTVCSVHFIVYSL